MKVYKEITSLLEFTPWSGAIGTYNKLLKAGKAEEFVAHIEQVFAGEDVSETEINDMLWFEPETCYELVGLDKDGNEEAETFLTNYTADFVGATILKWYELYRTYWRQFWSGF